MSKSTLFLIPVLVAAAADFAPLGVIVGVIAVLTHRAWSHRGN